MIDRKNRYGRTAARNHDADGLARRPSSTTIDIHAHIDRAARPPVRATPCRSQPGPAGAFCRCRTRKSTRSRKRTSARSSTTIDRRLFDLDKMDIDIQVVAPAPPQCYYSVDPKIPGSGPSSRQ